MHHVKYYSRVNPFKCCSFQLLIFQLFVRMLFQMLLVMMWITKLPAANVTFELSDSGMLRHVTTQVCSRQETFTANLAPVRVAPSVCGFVYSQGVQTCIAPMTLRTLVFIEARATRHCALQKHKYRFCRHQKTRAQQL